MKTVQAAFALDGAEMVGECVVFDQIIILITAQNLCWASDLLLHSTTVKVRIPTNIMGRN